MICRCIHCGKSFSPNPRIRNQRYCTDSSCQKARRAKWSREKMASDPDYKDNKKVSQERWLARHPGYYKKYRAKHPEYVKRNRLLQLMRNSRRRKNKTSKMIAKIDALTGGLFSRKGELFKLIPQGYGVIAKMNSCIVKLIPYKGLGNQG